MPIWVAKHASEHLDYLGRAAGAMGAIGGTITLVDAIRRNDTQAALTAGMSCVTVPSGMKPKKLYKKQIAYTRKQRP